MGNAPFASLPTVSTICLSHCRGADLRMSGSKLDETRGVICEPRHTQRKISLRIRRVIERWMDEVIDRARRDAEQPVDAGNVIDGELRHRSGKRNADDPSMRGASDHFERLIDRERIRIGELITLPQ